ncbi:glycosyltransferase [Flavobacterium daemonense]|uniref:glycosyltransferase n=1 Tax=Flavobacterium daemonense TaxID=1393049 RepID=UPI00118489FF|nr:glycosyltransferase family 2 protein [Flavobacterium daemonense]KAF2332510.1 glycosyltransferase [Flavobacterium daemonense]
MISILICTYKRPALLKTCIESILNQNANYDFEIIVIDNDPEETAIKIIEKYNGRIKYFLQPLRGLSHARNMAISKASGEIIVFIDDDEYADKNWLSNMIYCHKKYQADVVLGKVEYEIPSTFPLYIRQSSYFKRKSRITGEKATFNDGYTGNTLVKRELFNLRTPAFLLKFNHTGGEDSEFFNYLLSKGANIVFSNDAIIYETQDQQRLKITWFYKRGYRSGSTYAGNLFQNNNAIIASIKLVYSIIGGLIFSFILVLGTLIMPYKYFIKMVVKLANQFGKLGYVVGLQIESYHYNEIKN